MPNNATEYFVIFTDDEDSDNNMESLEPGGFQLSAAAPTASVSLSLGSLCDSNRTRLHGVYRGDLAPDVVR